MDTKPLRGEVSCGTVSKLVACPVAQRDILTFCKLHLIRVVTIPYST
jgi:hypothetical protein